MYIFITFFKDIKYSSLYHTVSPCWLSILYIVVCIRKSQTPNLSPSSSTSPLVNINLCLISVTLFLFSK